MENMQDYFGMTFRWRMIPATQIHIGGHHRQLMKTRQAHIMSSSSLLGFIGLAFVVAGGVLVIWPESMPPPSTPLALIPPSPPTTNPPQMQPAVFTPLRMENREETPAQFLIRNFNPYMGAVPDGDAKGDIQKIFEEMLRLKPRFAAPGRWIDLLEPPADPLPQPDILPQLANEDLYREDRALMGVKSHWAAFAARNPRTAAWFESRGAGAENGRFPIPLAFHYRPQEKRLDTRNYLKHCGMIEQTLSCSCGPRNALATHVAYADFLWSRGDDDAKDLAYRMLANLAWKSPYLAAELPGSLSKEECEDLARLIAEEMLWAWHGTNRWRNDRLGAGFHWPLDPLRASARRDAITTAIKANGGKNTSSCYTAHIRDPFYLTVLKYGIRHMDLSADNRMEMSWKTDYNWRGGTIHWLDLFNAYAGSGDFLAASFCQHCGTLGQLRMLNENALWDTRTTWRNLFGPTQGDDFFGRYLDACRAQYGPIYRENKARSMYFDILDRVRCRFHADRAIAAHDAASAIAWLHQYPTQTPDEKKRLDNEIKRLSTSPAFK